METAGHAEHDHEAEPTASAGAPAIWVFSARASHVFDIGIFNSGDYIHAVQQKINTEAISKILYPSDAVQSGRELRLLQEYFLVACAVRDILRRYLERHESLDQFAGLIDQLDLRTGKHPVNILGVGAYYGETVRKAVGGKWHIKPVPFGEWLPSILVRRRKRLQIAVR